MKFTPPTFDDIEQIQEWIAQDPYHRHQGQPEWWLGDGALLAFCLMDDVGPLTYVRLDAEGEYVRIHTQFAPKSVVSQERLRPGIVAAMGALKTVYSSRKFKGFVFESVSPLLIRFMRQFGFKPIGGNDYRADFEGTN